MSQITNKKLTDLYLEYKPRLYAASDKIIKDHQRVEDVLQELFLRLQKQDYNKIKDHLHEWMFLVCRNLSIKQYHKRNRYLLVENVEDSEEFKGIDETPAVYETMEKQELITAMMKLLKKIPKNQQKAVKLRYFNNLSYAEIAKKMKTTTGNVGFMLNNAAARIKKLLDQENLKKGYY